MKSNRIVLSLILAAACSMAACTKKQQPAPEPTNSSAQEEPAAPPVAKKEVKPVTVADIQNKLIQHGAKLKADGKMGAKTKAAIKKFQAKNGIKATGVADHLTLEKLGLSQS
jgi:peptidoglycan hydrolase-like protein with peptidoglycan-binding domain